MKPDIYFPVKVYRVILSVKLTWYTVSSLHIDLAENYIMFVSVRVIFPRFKPITEKNSSIDQTKTLSRNLGYSPTFWNLK